MWYVLSLKISALKKDKTKTARFHSVISKIIGRESDESGERHWLGQNTGPRDKKGQRNLS